MAATKISWTAMVNKDGTVTPGKVWNPVTGCTEVSAGCAHCYARRMAKRLQAMGQPHYANGFTVTCHDDALDIPLHWRKPARIFVNSMSDLFHKDVPVEFIARVFDVMKRCPQHTFMILTKRPELIAGYKLQNIWLGVSVENQKAADDRIPLLLRVDAAIRFLSCEPLLGQLDLSRYLWDKRTVYPASNLPSEKLHMVIVGGESGPHCRPMELDWARSIRDQCKAAGVPFFFKQAGGLHHGSDLLDGVEYKEFPR